MPAAALVTVPVFQREGSFVANRCVLCGSERRVVSQHIASLLQPATSWGHTRFSKSGQVKSSQDVLSLSTHSSSESPHGVTVRGWLAGVDCTTLGTLLLAQ